MIERHQDYVLRGITVGANATKSFIVPLDQDAPFALRQIYSVMPPFQVILQGFDDRSYMAAMGLAAEDSLTDPGNARPVYPQITFPSQTSIQVTIRDLSGSGISNGTLVLRGTKLYHEGAVFGPQYPAKFSELNFRYQFNFTVAASATVTNLPIDIQSDADFVFRMAAGLNFGGDPFSTTGTFCTLRDQYGKAFSNDWVPMQFLFPIPSIVSNNSGAIAAVSPDVTVYPEIYVAKSTQLLLDIMRSDGLQSTTFGFTFHGSKIYPLL